MKQSTILNILYNLMSTIDCNYDLFWIKASAKLNCRIATTWQEKKKRKCKSKLVCNPLNKQHS